MSYFTRSRSSPEERFSAACESGDYNTAKGLIEAFPNLDVNWMNSDQLDRTPLILACKNNRVRIVDLLLSHPRIEVNQPGFDGENPLLISLAFSNSGCARLLLRNSEIDTMVACAYKVQSLVWLVWNNDNALHVLKEWIACDRGLPIAPLDEYWDLDAIEQARESRFPEVATLLERYKNDPGAVKTEMEVWFVEGAAAEMFSLIVFLCDDILRIPKARVKSNAGRFFSIACRLPTEIQMVLCERYIESGRDTIVPDHKEMAFRDLALCYIE